MYREVLKVYDEDCILFNTEIYGTAHEIGKTDYKGPQTDVNFRFNWLMWGIMLFTWLFVFVANSRGIVSMRFVFYITFPLSVILVLTVCTTGM